jgi:hypothetical protein
MMTKNALYTKLLVILGMICFGAATASADYMELVNRLTRSTGVTDQQAMGGAGSIFKTAQKNMSTDNFSKIANVIPGMDNLLNAAPKESGIASSLGSSVSGVLGKQSPSLSSTAALAESFSKLGLDADMVNQFLPIVYDYVQSKGGDVLMSLMQNALI